MSRSLPYSIHESSQVGDVRRQALDLANKLKFGETEASKVGIVVTELANNLIKHAGQGKIILRHLDEWGWNGLEVLSSDSGPGMADIDKCLEDGYSSAGSPGTGLGAVSRLSGEFDIYSQPDLGTVALARLWPQPVRPKSQFVNGALCVPLIEGEPCGDAWAIRHQAGKTQILLADGVGHGPPAAKAAEDATSIFADASGLGPVALIKELHGPLRSTRGASLAIAEIEHDTGLVRYAGIGNICGTIISAETSRSMVSHNGTVGHEMVRVQEFTYPWNEGSTLVMHSDGLMTRWTLANYPGLILRHPSVIAAVLCRDFRRGRDDASVIVVRGNHASA